MKVTKITATFEATIPTQRYGNIKVGGTMEAELEAGDNPAVAYHELFTLLKEQVQAELKPIAARKLKAVSAILQQVPAHDSDEIEALLGTINLVKMLESEVESLPMTVKAEAIK